MYNKYIFNYIALNTSYNLHQSTIECCIPNLKTVSITITVRHFVIHVSFSNYFWSSTMPFGNIHFGTIVQYCICSCFDGEVQPLTYLTCTSAWGIWLYFRLHYKSLQQCAKQSMCGLWTTCLCIWFLAIPRCPLTPYHFTDLSLSFTKVATPPKTTEDTCCIHYYGFWDRLSNYVVKVTHSVNR